jgi:adenylate cyclase
MATFTRTEAARRAGVDQEFFDRLAELEIIRPAVPDHWSPGDVRRAAMIRTLADGGVPLEGLATSVHAGRVSFDFLDTPAYERFAALSDETFGQASARTGVPLELLSIIREATGLAQPAPDDRLREDELPTVRFVEAQVAAGFRPVAIERLLRVEGDCTRRIAEQEGAWWQSEVIAPAIAAGKDAEAITNPQLAIRMSIIAEASMVAMYHAQQARVWTTNLIDGLEVMLTEEGLHNRLERPPAICFLDITGYTRLTQERGDDAAAELASTLSRLVQRTSIQHGGKPIKWLGDGVMLYFRDAGPGVLAALEMVAGMTDSGLPPAHVGLHAGPVLFQEGDYFGQTVNLSARIAEYARPGEVLVSRAVADAAEAGEAGEVRFQDIGEVDLKGVGGPTQLLRAYRTED